MWWRNTYENKVDITPRGEEDRHIAEPSCDCKPIISADTEQRMMIIHNSFDGREGFEPVPDFEEFGRRAA